jgi:hypothetical protein
MARLCERLEAKWRRWFPVYHSSGQSFRALSPVFGSPSSHCRTASFHAPGPRERFGICTLGSGSGLGGVPMLVIWDVDGTSQLLSEGCAASYCVSHRRPVLGSRIGTRECRSSKPVFTIVVIVSIIVDILRSVDAAYSLTSWAVTVLVRIWSPQKLRSASRWMGHNASPCPFS